MKWVNRIRSTFADALSVEEKGIYWSIDKTWRNGYCFLSCHDMGTYGKLHPVISLMIGPKERQYIYHLGDRIGDGMITPPRRPEYNLPQNWIFA